MLSDLLFVEFAKGFDEKGIKDNFQFSTTNEDLYPMIRFLLSITCDEIA